MEMVIEMIDRDDIDIWVETTYQLMWGFEFPENKDHYIWIPNCSCQILSSNKSLIQRVRTKHKGNTKGRASQLNKYLHFETTSPLFEYSQLQPSHFHNLHLITDVKFSANSENCTQQIWAMWRTVDTVTEKKVVLLLSYYSFNKCKSMSPECAALCSGWY